MTIRGIRNNNPGNLEYCPATAELDGCLGVEDPPEDGSPARFCRFSTMLLGIRAAAIQPLLWVSKDGVAPIIGDLSQPVGPKRGIIPRWAPGTENNTAAYIDRVSVHTEWKPTSLINLWDGGGSLDLLMTGIFDVEVTPAGLAAIDESDLWDGIAAALVHVQNGPSS